LAASRPICDAEWLPIDRQIAQSGKPSRRKFISRSEFPARFSTCRNENRRNDCRHQQRSEAPIFDIADYGIVGDIFDAMPVLIEKSRSRKAKKPL
jgi:electron transfer flavoprotein alpha subunit